MSPLFYAVGASGILYQYDFVLFYILIKRRIYSFLFTVSISEDTQYPYFKSAAKLVIIFDIRKYLVKKMKIFQKIARGLAYVKKKL